MSNINTILANSAHLLRAAVLISCVLLPLNSTSSVGERSLSFFHTHTHETLEVTYSVGGEYVESALEEINDFLGDFRTGGEMVIDPRLLDLIYDVRASLDSNDTYEVISAYRSPETNEKLRSKSSGVAKKSQHLLGKAIDVRLRNVDSRDLRDAALKIKRGGVGYYKKSDFVHMDTGRVRRW